MKKIRKRKGRTSEEQDKVVDTSGKYMKHITQQSICRKAWLDEETKTRSNMV